MLTLLEETDYKERLRESVRLASRHHQLRAIGEACSIKQSAFSNFMRGGPLGPRPRAALEDWLRAHGYWEVEERGTHYLRHGEMAQPEGPEEEPPGMREHAAGYPLVSGAEALARLHDAQAAMWRSGLPTEEKMALEETWLASYVVALQKLGRLPG